MAMIVIKDLPDSVELDRQAMLAIAGGARSRGRSPLFGRANLHSGILKYPGTFYPIVRSSLPKDRQSVFAGRKSRISAQG